MSNRKGCIRNEDDNKPLNKLPNQVLDQSPTSQFCSNSDIPGFYYDSIKKRYFRLLPGNNNHNCLNVASLQREDRKKTWKRLREDKSNVSCELNGLAKKFLSRQLGALSSTQFYSYTHKLAMAKLELTCERSLNNSASHEPYSDCSYLIGTSDTSHLIGSWRLCNKPGVLIQGITFEDSELKGDSETELKTCLINIHPKNTVTDMCWARISPEQQFVLYSCCSSDITSSGRGSVHLLPCRSLCDNSSAENRERQLRFSQCYEYENTAIWSCAFAKCTKQVAIGTEGCIYTRNIESGSMNRLSSIKENPLSLIFNSDGSLLYSGTNKGNLSCTDLRESNSISYSTLLDRGITYMQLLSDENYVVVSAFNDKLQLLDLRRRKPLFYYPEHKNDHLKIPFSLNEKANTLCSTSDDQTTRLWALKEGKILASIPPPTEIIQDSSMAAVLPWVWYSEAWHSSLGMGNVGAVLIFGKKFFWYKPTFD